MNESSENQYPDPASQKPLFHFFYTLASLPKAIRFIREERLWEGILSYGWVTRLLILGGILVGVGFVKIMVTWVQTFMQVEATSINTFASVFGEAASEGYRFFTAGAFKYLLLILLEVLTYHFMRRSLITLCKIEDEKTSFRDFLDAQIRMIKVAFKAFILESIALLLLGILFGIVGFLDFLEPIFAFTVQCYFLGFAIFDNFTEQFDLTIKESEQFARSYVGVVLATGLLLYIFLLIPIVGTAAGPVITAVIVALVMSRLSNLHETPAPEVAE